MRSELRLERSQSIERRTSTLLFWVFFMEYVENMKNVVTPAFEELSSIPRKSLVV